MFGHRAKSGGGVLTDKITTAKSADKAYFSSAPVVKENTSFETHSASKSPTICSENELRPTLLLLVHRLPYPPNKGDKIRSYHLLCYLQQRYRVFLGTFIDDSRDWQYVERVQTLCEQVHIEPLQPLRAKLGCANALLTRQPLTLAYYRHKGMQRWVSELLEEQKIERAVVFSAAMAQYLSALPTAKLPARRIIDFVDVDSDKWRQYAAQQRGPARWLYRREAALLGHYECTLAKTLFERSLFVSQAEAQLFRSRLQPLKAPLASVCSAAAGCHGSDSGLDSGPGSEQVDSYNTDPYNTDEYSIDDYNVDYYNNGVDSEYFCPDATCVRPFLRAQRIIVFSGAMDYWPNEDAVCWFVEDVLPLIVSRYPDTYFYIVGSQPSRRVQALAQHAHTSVTGRVDDMRPYLQHADLCIAPMRVARGVQNKVLEAMAMARPVVTSPAGLEGITAQVGEELLLASEPEEYLRCVTEIFSGRCDDIGVRARKRILSDYTWALNLAVFSSWLEAPAVVATATVTGCESAP